MSALLQLHQLGQSLWLDQINRTMLDDGTLERYIATLGITGLTSNPSIFAAAISGGNVYDAGIRAQLKTGRSGEALVMALALEDLRRAADLFRPIFDSSDQLDGWVSMEVSPLLADDTAASVEAARIIHRQADRPNLFVKLPGTPAGLPAIEEAIFQGIPVNVTLLFSREQYLAAAQAWLRGLERRLAAGLDLRVASVASLFISRWDVAAAKAVPHELPVELRNRLGIAIGQRTYAAYRKLLASPRWQVLAAAGARPQRLLWASTGSKDPTASPTLYVEALAAPQTVNTLPEPTLLALAAHAGKLKLDTPAEPDHGVSLLTRFAQAGVRVDLLAEQLQRDGVHSFAQSWQQLLTRISERSAVLSSAEAAIDVRRRTDLHND